MKLVGKILYTSTLLILLIMVLIIVFFNSINNRELSFFGYEARTILSDSMDIDKNDVSEYQIKSLKRHELVLIEKVSDGFYDKVKVGDVLTFKYVIGTSQEVITHRVIKIEKVVGGYIFTLKGDNVEGIENVQVINTTEDITSYNYVIGKVVYANYFLGLIITILKKPIGIILTIIIPCVVLMFYEIINIFQIIFSSKEKQKISILQKKIFELEGRC